MNPLTWIEDLLGALKATWAGGLRDTHDDLGSCAQNVSTRLERARPGLLLMALAALAALLAHGQALAQGITTTSDITGATQSTDGATKIFSFLLGTFFTSPLSSAMGAPSLIGSLFLIFNSAVFLVGTVWATYGILSGIVETADKGQVLGRKQSIVWLPIRMSIGVVGIVPVFAGFSLSQVLIVVMTGMGIGLGNLMFNGAIGVASNFETVVPPTMASGASGSSDFRQAADGLFISDVCLLAQRQQERETTPAVPPNQTIGAQQPQTLTPNGTLLAWQVWGTPDLATMCGGATLRNTGIGGRSSSSALSFRVASVKYDAYAGQVITAYTSAFPTFASQVQSIAQTWWTLRTASQTQSNPPVPMPAYPSSDLDNAAQAYAMAISSAARTATSNGMQTEGSALSQGIVTQMKADGWISLGGWYATFAEAGAALADAMRAVRLDVVPPSGPFDGQVADAMTAVTKSLSATSSDATTSTIATSPDGAGATALFTYLKGSIGLSTSGNTPTGNLSLGQSIVANAINAAAIGSGGGGNSTLTSFDNVGWVNPIIMFKNMGDYFMTAGATIMSLQAAASLISDTLSAPAPTAGNGSLMKSVTGAVTNTVGAVVTDFIPAPLRALLRGMGKLLSLLAPYLIIMGMLMAIYIPMIPFITWVGGVIQYAVVVCEGLVGAPIAALAHLESEGEGLGQRTQAGYMFVLNVLFRPSLMIFGFFLASALMIAMGTLIAHLFLGAMANAQGNSMTGFLSVIGYITVFMVINITLIQGLFNMIFLMADNVLNMIGSGGATNNLGKDVDERLHGMFVGVSRNVNQVSGEFMGKAQKNAVSGAEASGANAAKLGGVGARNRRGGA